MLFQAKMKQLEQEAHQAAGQMFLITSNSQLRMVCIKSPNTILQCCKILILGKVRNVYLSFYIVYVCYVCAHVSTWVLLINVCLLQLERFVHILDLQCLKVLFEKLRLHEHCKNKKLPKTINKQHQSTSEATVWSTQTHKHRLISQFDPQIFFRLVFFWSFSMHTDNWRRQIHKHTLSHVCYLILINSHQI